MKASQEMSQQGTFNLMIEGVAMPEIAGILSKFGSA
jgi:hypothetical protein